MWCKYSIQDMMKRLFLSLTIVLAAFSSRAAGVVPGNWGDDAAAKPVTLNISSLTGYGLLSNHYISDWQFGGLTLGWSADVGRYFKNSENGAWKLAFRYAGNAEILGGMTDASNMESVDFKEYALNYSVYYNWHIGDGFRIKLGGAIDVVGDLMSAKEIATNNAVSANGTALLEAVMGMNYTFGFDNWMLALYADASSPLGGVVFTDSKHESGLASILPGDRLMNGYDRHFKGTAIPSMTGVDCDFGIRFITPKLTIGLACTSYNRWWYVNDIQNYRSNSYLKLSLGFDLVGARQTKTTQRYF